MKKGDIFKNGENCYFYYKGSLDDDHIFSRCIITQSGDIRISSDIVHLDLGNLVETSIDVFIKNKFNFEENVIIDFKHPKYENGVIREIDTKSRMLFVEVEDEENCEYVDISISFDDVCIVYPEFTYNMKHKFK